MKTGLEIFNEVDKDCNYFTNDEIRDKKWYSKEEIVKIIEEFRANWQEWDQQLLIDDIQEAFNK